MPPHGVGVDGHSIDVSSRPSRGAASSASGPIDGNNGRSEAMPDSVAASNHTNAVALARGLDGMARGSQPDRRSRHVLSGSTAAKV